MLYVSLKMIMFPIWQEMSIQSVTLKPWMMNSYLNDLIAVERKLERLREEKAKGGGRDKVTIDRETELFERFKQTLNDETPLRDIEITQDEEKSISGFRFT